MTTAKIVADSVNEFGDRITSVIATFPRFILAELNTHRAFSRNSASSRAIPSKKMIKMVEENPVLPIAWQKEHKGMQGTEYLDNLPANELNPEFRSDITARDILNGIWAGGYKDDRLMNYGRPEGSALYHAVECAKELLEAGATKQLVNRLLEPFMWHTALITATDWENFFKLRCPQYTTPVMGEGFFAKSWEELKNNHSNHQNLSKMENMASLERLQHNKGQAEIHMMALAEAIYDAMNESKPRELKAGEWHIVFGDNIDENALANLTYRTEPVGNWFTSTGIEHFKIKIATARGARVSYLNYEGKDDYESDFKLFKTLKDSGHMSPFEHCAKAMSRDDVENYMVMENGKVDVGRCRNFKGFIQLRAMIE